MLILLECVWPEVIYVCKFWTNTNIVLSTDYVKIRADTKASTMKYVYYQNKYLGEFFKYSACLY